MGWFSVHLETRGDDPADVTDDQFGEELGELVNALIPRSGVVTGGVTRPTWGATISVEADSAALGHGQGLRDLPAPRR